ncbi:MAG: aminomethyl-transferring glycine dehydrogenase [Bacteroidales bacterium]|nr:aminomethyl-transferring glycine dehydrogenase [Bacteroidales bacterium]
MTTGKFAIRHIGPRDHEIKHMLSSVGVNSLDELIKKTIPETILLDKELDLPEGISEYDYLKQIKKIASKNKVFKSYIGMGYYNTIFPAVIQRNVLENPGWYTSYTPYQAEISQGRLEALLNFQTVITELTGMEIANASLLDESTAAAEGMIMLFNARSREEVKNGHQMFFVDSNIFPQTLDVLKTRSKPLGIELVVGDYKRIKWDSGFFGAFVQYPAGDGKIEDYKDFTQQAHQNGTHVIVAADILSLVLLTPPGEWDADVVVGSTQRLGIPMGFGGPHAAYFATLEKFKRNIPGRIIGVSSDRLGNTALRMALQTREQHIKREKATSNICTSQALLAIMAGFYSIYHGPDGLKNIAEQIHQTAGALSEKLKELGYQLENTDFFDTLKILLPENISSRDVKILALERDINFRYFNNSTIGISIDETTGIKDLNKIVEVFSYAAKHPVRNVIQLDNKIYFNSQFLRKSEFLKQNVFYRYRSETELMRYIKRLERKDISLTHSMISLGSCTMKLNAASELFPLSWSEFGEIHPFAPIDQTEGYQQLFHELEKFLRIITGFEAISFQPNSGAAGEYTGLMVIRSFHEKNNEGHRNIVLIPASAHGTNPASAVMAGMKVIVIKCDDQGNIDIEDLKNKAVENKNELAALMVTYPSTHGVFEADIIEMIDIVHKNGGQVYMDGANMNAQVGLTSPAKIGADVCHLNLHKTFAIPHGGGGPGAGPIAVAEHLIEFLPTHPVVETGGINGVTAVAGAPWGSASILTIAHAYCTMMGKEGLAYSSKIAILNANYIAAKLKDYFPVLYTGSNGFVAHEMIIDCRPFKQPYNITETDIAKRLMDYGFHAPTLSFPVHGTLMVEPTESESLQELNLFIETMISIYKEILQINKVNWNSNILKNAPHIEGEVIKSDWSFEYSREQAAFPLPWIRENKYWPAVTRIDDALGDRNLVCTCAPIAHYL